MEFGPNRCVSRPDNGKIFVPPVGTFVYNGTEAANNNWPVTTYRWLGQINRAGDFDYHTTANAAEQPVGWFDYSVGLQTLYNSFSPMTPTGWPAGTWTAPTNCNGAAERAPKSTLRTGKVHH